MSLRTCALNLDQSRREMQSQGTADFPCAGYKTHRAGRSEEEIPWHYHEEMELLMISEGTLTVNVPGNEMVLEAGDGIWINSGVLHSARAVSDCGFRTLVFSPLLVCGSVDSAISRKYIEPLTKCKSILYSCLSEKEPEQSGFFTEFGNAFAALEEDKFGYEILVRGFLSRLCLYFRGKYADMLEIDNGAPPIDVARARKMLDYIHANPGENLRLADLAGIVNISPREALRCFQRVLRISPIQYALKYRVMRSADELSREPGKSVQMIAEQFGFESSSYYTKLFRRYTRCTPTEYRKMKMEQS